jgi:uncharacterized protein (DUF1800 family)
MVRAELPRYSRSVIAVFVALLLTKGIHAAEPAREIKWDEAAARHLLSRTSFSASPKQVQELVKKPLKEAVRELLDAAAKGDSFAKPDWVRDVWVNKLRRYSDMPREEYLVTFRRASTRNDEELADLKARWVQQMVSSPTPLRENLTLFWHGHFTSASSKMFAVTQAFYQQHETWHKHALGNFRQFLEAVTLDPGMLIYLDMEESNKDHPNENYARELLELFALGVGNYTERDIREIARAFTGWTLDAPPGTVKPDRPTSSETARSMVRDGLLPRFRAERHDAGSKTILGKTGNFGVKEVLDIIVQHPACGKHVASRLIDYFGAYDPNGELRQRMAKAFVDSEYEIRPMLVELLTSPEFYAAEARGRVKSPVRLLVGACRDFGLEGEITPGVVQSLVPLGQELFNPPTVKGWPTGNAWVTSTTLALRYRLSEVLINGQPISGTQPLGRIRGTLIPRDAIEGPKTVNRLLALDAEKSQTTTKEGFRLQLPIAGLPLDDSAKLVDYYLLRTFSITPRSITSNALIEACANTPTAERAKIVAKLILASPEYQVE